MYSNRLFSFAIDAERGFLPKQNPLIELPPNAEWNRKFNQLAKNIPQLLKEKKLRIVVDALNQEFEAAVINGRSAQVTVENLAQKNAALLMLLMIAQAYLWEDANNKPRNMLPAVLAKNIYPLCKMQQRYPTLTYADYVLNNWRLKDQTKKITLDNIEPLFTFTGSLDEAWFIKIHVAIEAVFAKALDAAQRACALADDMVLREKMALAPQQKDEDEEVLTEFLTQINHSLAAATKLLQGMKTGCDPHYFWHTLRSHFNGWEKISVKVGDKEETGVRFSGVDAESKIPAHRYIGASGAQSSSIPALDRALGVKHEMNNMFQTAQSFEHYMPLEHRAFIMSLQQNKIRKIVAASDSPKLIVALEDAVTMLQMFREGHRGGLVKRYIFDPAEEQGISREQITGTGGTVEEYLQTRSYNTKARAHL